VKIGGAATPQCLHTSRHCLHHSWPTRILRPSRPRPIKTVCETPTRSINDVNLYYRSIRSFLV